MTSQGKYHVGQKVYRRDINSRGEDKVVTIDKVGRSLVHTSGYYGRTETYRISDGTRNDRYGHSWILTEGERAELLHRADLVKRLHAAGFEVLMGRSIPTGTLDHVVRAAEMES